MQKKKSKSDNKAKGDRSKSQSSSKIKDKRKDKSITDRPGDSVGNVAVDNLLGLDFTSFGENHGNENIKRKTSTAKMVSFKHICTYTYMDRKSHVHSSMLGTCP